METVGEDTQAGERSGDPGAVPRRGQSGEGAGSAMEQLIQQEKMRDAQLPRENEGPPPPAPRP